MSRLNRENIEDAGAIREPGDASDLGTGTPGAPVPNTGANAGDQTLAVTQSSPPPSDDESPDTTGTSSDEENAASDDESASGEDWQSMSAAELEKAYSREQLNGIATAAGVPDADQLRTKSDVATAIVTARDAAPIVVTSDDGDNALDNTVETDELDPYAEHPQRDDWVIVRGRAKPNYIAISDSDARHPGGLLFLTGNQSGHAYLTSNVLRAIANRAIERVD